MGYIIQWDNAEKTVVLQQYTDDATKDDWYQMAQESARMLNSVPHTVHLIIDERNVNLVATAADMHFLEDLVPANEGTAVIVTSRMKFRYKQLSKKIREQILPGTSHEAHFVESIEDARKLLQEQYGVVYSTASS
jgi:hypothetical protein